MRNVSVATRLAISVVGVAIISLVVVAIFGINTGESLGGALLDGRFAAVNSSKADEITSYVSEIRTQTAVLAASPMTVDAARRFTDAYAELGSIDQGTIDTATEDVALFYADDLIPKLAEVRGHDIGIRDVLPVENAAIYLQQKYLADISQFDFRPRAVDDAEDGSTWSEVHREVHPVYRDMVDQLGFEDLYIVEPDTRSIVYSTNKSPDFATNLGIGPHSGTTLSTLVDTIVAAPEKGAVVIEDFARYAPDLDAPVGFLGSPILDGDELVGVLAARFPTDRVNQIMTSDGDWEAQGMGASGEAYLVGPTGRMRSDSRLFIENPPRYLATAEAAGTLSPEEMDAIESSGTTILSQRVDTSALAEASAEGDEVVDSTNYLGSEVFSSYQPLEIDDLEWSLITQVERAEASSGLESYRRELILVMALIVVALTFLAVVWANRAIRPVRALTDRIRRLPVTETVPDRETPPGPDDGLTHRTPDEFVRLSSSIDRMIESLRERKAAVAAASAERLDVIRSLLPPEIVRRIEAGDRRVLDHVPGATVVALVVEGLGRLEEGRSTADSRVILDAAVGTLDALAEKHGLERVKLVGDTYFAVCGVNRPYLDHAPRGVAFAVEARDAFADLRVDERSHLDLATGIHSGPVTAGLAGSARLVYDLWGQTVSTAHYLARAARKDQVLISEETRIHLPPNVIVEARTDLATVDVWTVIGIRAEEVADA